MGSITVCFKQTKMSHIKTKEVLGRVPTTPPRSASVLKPIFEGALILNIKTLNFSLYFLTKICHVNSFPIFH